MQYRSLGRTGVQVSEICLGTMAFGSRADRDESTKMIDYALDVGVNFVDTADIYGGNESERIVGASALPKWETQDCRSRHQIQRPSRRRPEQPRAVPPARYQCL